METYRVWIVAFAILVVIIVALSPWSITNDNKNAKRDSLLSEAIHNFLMEKEGLFNVVNDYKHDELLMGLLADMVIYGKKEHVLALMPLTNERCTVYRFKGSRFAVEMVGAIPVSYYRVDKNNIPVSSKQEQIVKI